MSAVRVGGGTTIRGGVGRRYVYSCWVRRRPSERPDIAVSSRTVVIAAWWVVRDGGSGYGLAKEKGGARSREEKTTDKIFCKDSEFHKDSLVREKRPA